MRVRFALAFLGLALLCLVCPVELLAQMDGCEPEVRFGKPRKYSWEFSPFFGIALFDSENEADADLEDHGSYGARIAFNWTRHWGTEVTLELSENIHDQHDVIGEEINATFLDLGMVFNLNTDPKKYPNQGRWKSWDRWTPYFAFGAGYASFERDSTGHPWNEDNTFHIGGGTRLMLGRLAGLRFDTRARVIPGADVVEVSPTLGFSWIMGGEPLRDSDNDGILDDEDRCPGTPQGCDVDCFGCHYDQDGDGVCDGIDRCEDTTDGCYVDAWGCALDSDEDGVCDGLDNCPDTPKGCWVDENGCPKDSDNDGVCDGNDRCPDTPECCQVDVYGCPLDSDADGVCNGCDECPGTARGTKVDERGCAVLKLVLADIYFEFNKAVIRDFYYPFLDEVSKSLKADNNMYVVLELAGHTDAVGSNRYNYQLAERRAKAVKEYLVAKGIRPNRLIETTKGESQPIAGNNTEAGRRANRRVEMHNRGPEIDPSMIEHYNIVLEEVYFETDKAVLKPDYVPFLREVARIFREPRFRGTQIYLHGHADHRAQPEYNFKLSQRRAQAVKDFLVSQGINAGSISLRPLGENEAHGRSPAGMQKDRRVEVHSR